MIYDSVIHQILDSLTLCVSDEHLSEMVVANKFYELRYPIVVEFIENIV